MDYRGLVTIACAADETNWPGLGYVCDAGYSNQRLVAWRQNFWKNVTRRKPSKNFHLLGSEWKLRFVIKLFLIIHYLAREETQEFGETNSLLCCWYRKLSVYLFIANFSVFCPRVRLIPCKKVFEFSSKNLFRTERRNYLKEWMGSAKTFFFYGTKHS